MNINIKLQNNEKDYDYKIILHPNLTNWLLKHDFRISKVKASRQNPNHTIFVFAIEKGCMQLFFDCMNSFDKTKSRNNGDKFLSHLEIEMEK